MKNNLHRILYLLFGFIVYRLCSLIPKKKSLWIFGSWSGVSYSDNTKYFFEYINKNRQNITPVWLSRDKNIVKQISDMSYRAYNMNSLPGIWYAARSEYVFTTSAVSNVLNPLFITAKSKTFNLWHGTPLKVLGDNHDKTNSGEKKRSLGNKLFQLKSKLWPILFPFLQSIDDYFMSPSPEALTKLSSAFPGNGKTIHFSNPYPRNDVFKDSIIQPISRIIYMPTWRAYLGSSIDLFYDYEFDVERISKFLEANNLHLDLKLHKYSVIKADIRKDIETSKNISILDCPDIYDVINDYDLLITDYSSIYFDYLYTQKPIIFSPFDIESYQNTDHKFYYPYDTVTPGPKAMNWNDVVICIKEFISNPSLFSEERLQIHNTFNPVQDGLFSEQLYFKVMELTSAK